MISLKQYHGKKVAVFGLGKAGNATAAALIAGGARVFAWDDNEQSREAARKAVNNDNFLLISPERWIWKELACMVLSPGIPLTHNPHSVVEKARENGTKITGDIELLYEAAPDATYIAITGTNGKSTTTTLIGHIIKSLGIKAEVGGNLGTPALTFEPLGKGGVYVLELSSYQLDLLHHAKFNIACFLNVTPDHLDRHGDMQGYVAAKMHIFDRQGKEDTAIIATDDDYTKAVYAELIKRNESRVIAVSAHHVLQDGVYVENGLLREVADGKEIFSADIGNIVSLTGRHNWQNAAIAFAAVKKITSAGDAIINALRTFPGLAHRMEFIADINGVRYINDSKATNADATSNALAPYDNIYWILGGKPKEGGIESLKEYFPKIAHAFLVGQATDEFARTLEGKVPYDKCGTVQNAFDAAHKMAQVEKKKGAVVMLSPACASWDQWKSFEERGDAFRTMVKRIR